mmetsp:Transcript_2509/g.3653  ORF Transcript_2509/g.3653 Transcript_2509/m.3653 type:complete len:89 (+) Transcript_2509:244-510(+)
MLDSGCANGFFFTKRLRSQLKGCGDSRQNPSQERQSKRHVQGNLVLINIVSGSNLLVASANPNRPGDQQKHKNSHIKDNRDVVWEFHP